MTNPTPHGRVPAIQRYKIGYHCDEWGVRSLSPTGIYDDAGPWVRYEDHIAALHRLHAENEALRTTHVQNPAEIEHVAGDVPKNVAESNMNAYAELPPSVGEYKYGGGLYTDAQMRVFADATHALRTQQPAPVTQQAGEVPESIEQLAVARYKVVPAHESMLHRWAVVAGDGAQQLYLGREVECENMARKFAGAFLDGAFYQANIVPTPPAQAADSVTAPAGGAAILKEILAAACCEDSETYLTNDQYRKLYDLQRRIESMPTQPTHAADSVLEDAARWQMAVLVGNEVMLHPDKRSNPSAVKAYMDAVHSGLDLTGAVDAARKQGANHDNS